MVNDLRRRFRRTRVLVAGSSLKGAVYLLDQASTRLAVRIEFAGF
jgi:hypothetical protein